MSYQLKVDEILEGLEISGHPFANHFIAELERVADDAAQALASHLNVKAGACSFQGLAFAGTCVAFRPSYEGQPLPEAIAGFDEAEEWG